MIQVQHVAPQDLHTWWDEVQLDVAECAVHDKESTWPEDVYMSIRAGQAALYVATVSGQYAGMMVTTVHVDQWEPSRKWLHVWYCNTRAGFEGVIEAGHEALEIAAKNMGACMITFRADRLAFERWGKRLGFKVGEIELRKEVHYG